MNRRVKRGGRGAVAVTGVDWTELSYNSFKNESNNRIVAFNETIPNAARRDT